MADDEINQWLDELHQAWKRLVNEQDAHQPKEWDELVASIERMAREGGDRTARQTNAQLAAWLKEFAALARKLLEREPPQDTAAATALLLEIHRELQQQTVTALLRQWQLPDSLAPLALAGLPQQIKAWWEGMQGARGDSAPEAFSAALLRHQQALLECKSHLDRLGSEVAARWLERWQESRPQTLEAIYRQWGEEFETAYRKLLLNADYARALASLNSTALELQSALQRLCEEPLRLTGAVPRSDYLALLEQHHSLKRRVRELEQQQAEQGHRLQQIEERLHASGRKSAPGTARIRRTGSGD